MNIATKVKFLIKGILYLIFKPYLAFCQPSLIYERLTKGVKKAISEKIYKKNKKYNYIDLYGYKFVLGENLHIFNEFLNELYPFITDKTIEPIIPEGSYFDNSIGFTVKEGDVVIDAGANLGFFSIPGAVRVGESGKVFAFEPSIEIRNMLQESVKENSLKNVEVVPFALGEKDGKASFETGGEYNMCSRVNVEAKVDDNSENVVQMRSIDSFISENGIGRLDFIKMDIEGFERYALMGGRNSIKKFRPKLSICTYHLNDDREVLTKIIKDIHPDYNIVYKQHKLFAW